DTTWAQSIFSGPEWVVSRMSLPPASEVTFPVSRSPFLSLTSSSAAPTAVSANSSIAVQTRMEVLPYRCRKEHSNPGGGVNESGRPAVELELPVADFVEKGLPFGRVEGLGRRPAELSVEKRQLLELFGRDLLELRVENFEVRLERIVRRAEPLRVEI